MNRPPLVSRIPATHPQKTSVEEACQRFLNHLGPQWFISIALTSDPQVWEICLGRRRSADARPRNRNWVVRPPSQNAHVVEKTLREAASQIRNESSAQFGMEPAGKLGDDARDQLRDLVILFGGRMDEKGWITLADDRAWQRFEDRVSSELGIRLVASVK